MSQEPVLFATSIKENVQHGKEDISDEQIIAAAKEANIHEFISMLPDVSTRTCMYHNEENHCSYIAYIKQIIYYFPH